MQLLYDSHLVTNLTSVSIKERHIYYWANTVEETAENQLVFVFHVYNKKGEDLDGFAFLLCYIPMQSFLLFVFPLYLIHIFHIFMICDLYNEILLSQGLFNVIQHMSLDDVFVFIMYRI